MTGNTTIEIKDPPLPAAPKRLAICPLDDVLALSTESKKR
jgi:hypothetical protein